MAMAGLVVFMASSVARADVAPPEDESCEGSDEGDWCSVWNGCENGTCIRIETNEDGEAIEVRYDCRLECQDEECVKCDEEDAGPPVDPDAGADAGDEDASVIFSAAGGCNIVSERASTFGPLLLALAVPLIIFVRRRLS